MIRVTGEIIMERDLESVAKLTWMWHDATVIKIELLFNNETDASVVVFSEINHEENISLLESMGIFSRCVCIVCSHLYEVNLEGVFPNTDLPTIAHWNVEMSGIYGIKSEIQSNNGESIKITSRFVLLTQW